MFKFLNKYLYKTILEPVWTFLDGKKTISGAIATALVIIIGLAGGDSQGVGVTLGSLLEVLIINTGVDPWLTAAEALTLVGIIDKVRKAGFDGEKKKG